MKQLIIEKTENIVHIDYIQVQENSSNLYQLQDHLQLLFKNSIISIVVLILLWTIYNRNIYVASTEFIFEEEPCDLSVFTQFTKLYENLQQWIYEDHSPSLETRLKTLI